MRRLPIGVDSFREIIEGNYYYVDKTMLIHDFLDGGDKVTLITRPRRFGKTLNMTMLKEFFDITADSKDLFAGLKISHSEYMDKMNTKPVIYFSFKDCESNTAEGMLEKLCNIIEPEVSRYYNLLVEKNVNFDSWPYSELKRLNDSLQSKKINFDQLESALLTLTRVAKSLYNKRALLLIDEYDAPIIFAYENNYKDQVDTFFSGFLGAALKSNDSLDRGILTGVQHIAEESITSGFNNVSVFTVLDKIYAAHFGFTENETEQLLSYYGMELTEDVRQMYGGYSIGGYNIFNPWSILKYADTHMLWPYWSNTWVSDEIVMELMGDASRDFTDDYLMMLKESEITVTTNLGTAYVEQASAAAIWGLLLNTGYLTAVRSKSLYDSSIVKIPNNEVKEKLQEIFAERKSMPKWEYEKLANGTAILGHCPPDVSRIVFLDIDGVLQPDNNRERFRHMSPESVEKLNKKLYELHGSDYSIYNKYDVAAVYYDWDKKAVQLLKNLLDMTGAKIVLSSSWRKKTINRMSDFFAIHDLKKYYIDNTKLNLSRRQQEAYPENSDDRTMEILEYVKRYPHIQQYVVIDDMRLRGLGEHFVETDYVFTKDHAEKAYSILTQAHELSNDVRSDPVATAPKSKHNKRDAR
jgi:hypothetical protein